MRPNLLKPLGIAVVGGGLAATLALAAFAHYSMSAFRLCVVSTRRIRMPVAYRFQILVTLLLLSSGLTSCPIFAQVDLSGKWVEKITEDKSNLFPGPEIGDYTNM